MSRPTSRRSFLAAASAVAATTGTTLPVLSAKADPVFALIEAERAAWDTYEHAIDVLSAAEEAFRESGFDRRARAQVGISVRFITGDGRRIPEEERAETPVYAYSRAEIERAYASSLPDDLTVETGGRRVRVAEVRHSGLTAALARFDADCAAIQAARTRFRIDELTSRQDEASAAAERAEAAAFAATPTTTAGLLAMLALFEEREMENLADPHDGYVAGIFAAVRSAIGGRA